MALVGKYAISDTANQTLDQKCCQVRGFPSL